MPSLKLLRNRIASVKSTKKITLAMKMVAASKLRQTQEQQTAGKPYIKAMKEVLSRIVTEIKPEDLLQNFPILNQTQENQTHLIIIVTSARGLCGGFNGNIVREAKKTIADLIKQEKKVKIICIGRKGHDLLKHDFSEYMIDYYEEVANPTVPFSVADEITKQILLLYKENNIGSCSILYNRFTNALIQTPIIKQIVPAQIDSLELLKNTENSINENDGIYRFEPDLLTLFSMILPQYIASSIFGALIDSAAGEQAARMNAMDNATNNAGDMINKLTIKYNRARQANITGELIEIISAMEAM